LRKALEKLPGLTKIWVNFAWCRKISGTGLQNLREGLLKLSSLEDLSLKFEW